MFQKAGINLKLIIIHFLAGSLILLSAKPFGLATIPSLAEILVHGSRSEINAFTQDITDEQVKAYTDLVFFIFIFQLSALILFFILSLIATRLCRSWWLNSVFPIVMVYALSRFSIFYLLLETPALFPLRSIPDITTGAILNGSILFLAGIGLLFFKPVQKFISGKTEMPDKLSFDDM